ncbi:MAG: substrate-binding domain-containing protein [Acidobacteriota bacterium]|nr:substrate-binding domain-containing protein [Acidobacteriota bacterium]
MKRHRFVLSVPGDTMYLRAQVDAAKAAADRAGAKLEVLDAQMDAVTQGQQLLRLVQTRPEARPDAILVEPVGASGLPRVAEAAVAAGIAWVVSNGKVDYVGLLRKSAKVPVFVVSQDHVEVGRIQGRQIGALLPDGGSVLYLRGPAMSWWATKRFEGLESALPKNVEVKSLKVQGLTDKDADKAVSSWLALSRARPEGTQLIMAQNADCIVGVMKALETNASPSDRIKWLAVPRAGLGTSTRVRPLVAQGVLTAAVVTSLTLDKAIEMLSRAMTEGKQPQEQTFVEAHSHPNLDELAKKSRQKAYPLQ